MKDLKGLKINKGIVYLRIITGNGAICNFSYSINGNKFNNLGKEFTAVAGKWVSACIDIFSLATEIAKKTGYTDFDWIRFN